MKLEINIDRNNNRTEICCPFCGTKTTMRITPITVNDKYCGEIFLCDGCYRHLMQRQESGYISIDGDEKGNLV